METMWIKSVSIVNEIYGLERPLMRQFGVELKF